MKPVTGMRGETAAAIHHESATQLRFVENAMTKMWLEVNRNITG